MPQNFSEQLAAYRERTGLSQAELADKLGVSRNYVSMLEGGRQPSESLRRLFEVIENSPLYGRKAAPAEGQQPGTVYAVEPFSARLKRWRERMHYDERGAAAVFGVGVVKYKEFEAGRKPTEAFRQKLEAIEHESPAFAEAARQYKADRLREEAATGGVRIPVVSASEPRVCRIRQVPVIGWTKAGEVADFEDVVDWENPVSVETNDPRAFAIRVKGDSMSPLISEGDLVVVSPSDRPVNEKYVVVRTTSGIVCKQLHILSPTRYELRSLNPFYQPMIVDAANIVWIYPVAHLIKKLL